MRVDSGAGPRLTFAQMSHYLRVLAVAGGLGMLAACSGSSGAGGTGGASATGGATGGASGGSTGGASGGSTGSGGASATGGAVGTGGTTSTGGAAGSAVSTGGHGGGAGAPGTGGGTAGSGGASAGGGHAGSGSTGTGGAAGAGTGPVTPTQETGSNSNLYRFGFGDVVMEVDAKNGGRVSSVSLAGTNLLVPPGTDPTTWGSVFWTSPRSAWMPATWPPPAAIDSDPYTAMISGNDLVMTGATDPTMGFAMTKDYAADGTTGWITINYTIKSTKAQKAAPWEVTRVPRGGMVFFPLGSSVSKGPLTITQSNGIVWFDDAAMTATSASGEKLTADGAMGWTAYVLGSSLFLKKYTDVPASQQATGEGEVCVYPGTSWIEYEIQGAYTSIAANGTLPWKVQWKIVKIPSSVTINAGSATLATFAQQQAGS
jgi:hypothetical protein